MSEETRGLIYRALVVVFFALVTFGVLSGDVADDYMQTILEVAALLGFSLASRNTAGPGGNR